MCAQHVNGAEPGYGSGQQSPLSEQQSSLDARTREQLQVLSHQDRLLQALLAQTEAITELAASVSALAEAIAQGDEDPAEDAIPRGMGKKQ